MGREGGGRAKWGAKWWRCAERAEHERRSPGGISHERHSARGKAEGLAHKRHPERWKVEGLAKYVIPDVESGTSLPWASSRTSKSERLSHGRHPGRRNRNASPMIVIPDAGQPKAGRRAGIAMSLVLL